MCVPLIVIISAETSDGMCDIKPSSSHRVYNAPYHRLLYRLLTGFILRLPLVKPHSHWHDRWSRLIHPGHPQDHPNVSMLLEVNHVTLPVAFNVRVDIEADTPEILHLEPLLHLILDLHNLALISNDERSMSYRMTSVMNVL